ncbi:MAG: hypothetical protein GC162_14925 [Planctomycetes bacterium]|nr:hypothetical protein [Planctomycetota bacterium]
MIFRLAQNLNTKIKVGSMAAAPLDENPYVDWSARLFTADRTQYILISNTRSLYSSVMYGRGITSDHEFIVRAFSSIREFMQDDGLVFVYRQFIAPATGTIRFRKALNRTVTGSMNELVAAAKDLLADGDIAPHDVGFKLNDYLLSALACDKSRHYGKPREAFKQLGP